MKFDGYGCRRGLDFAKSEFTDPVRLLTTTVKLAGRSDTVLAVRSSKPIPREKLMECMEVIRRTEAPVPVRQYDVIVSNILDTGADIVASASFGTGE